MESGAGKSEFLSSGSVTFDCAQATAAAATDSIAKFISIWLPQPTGGLELCVILFCVRVCFCVLRKVYRSIGWMENF